MLWPLVYNMVVRFRDTERLIVRFTNFDMRMFNEARKEAEKSTFDRFHVGAAIVYKHRIIGRGHNSDKTNPKQKMYNTRYRKFNNDNGGAIKHSIHAEICCLNSVPYPVGKDVDWSRAAIYVYRICPGKPRGYGNSFPCPACLNAIKDVGIKDVYYTGDNGLSYIRLD